MGILGLHESNMVEIDYYQEECTDRIIEDSGVEQSILWIKVKCE